jgi:hypothetical protein
MIKWRRESVLDLYNLLLSMFLFVSPWLFARASETATVDLPASGAAIATLSVAAMIAFANWEEWANLLLGVWLIVQSRGIEIGGDFLGLGFARDAASC